MILSITEININASIHVFNAHICKNITRRTQKTSVHVTKLTATLLIKENIWIVLAWNLNRCFNFCFHKVLCKGYSYVPCSVNLHTPTHGSVWVFVFKFKKYPNSEEKRPANHTLPCLNYLHTMGVSFDFLLIKQWNKFVSRIIFLINLLFTSFTITENYKYLS